MGYGRNKMILFYAWTDTQIINLVNIKLTVYRNDRADLLVYGLSRVSEELLNEVLAGRIFENIYFLEVPPFYLERCREGFREKLGAFFLGGDYRKYFNDRLTKFLGKKEYSLFLTGAFWSETLLVIRYLRKKNEGIKVMFYEEGLAAYNGRPKWLFRAVPNKGIKATIRTVLYYGFSAYFYRKYVKGIYLYKPELSNIDYIEKIRIPFSGNQKRFCSGQKNNELSGEKIYQDSEVIFIAEAMGGKDFCWKGIFNSILDVIFSVKVNAKVVIKAHPLGDIKEDLSGLEHYTGLYIDRNPERIETILSRIWMDDKVVITGNSSSALYLKWLYGKTPHMILMDFRRDRYVEEYIHRYITYYDDKKAYAPRNMDELKEILLEIFMVRNKKRG